MFFLCFLYSKKNILVTSHYYNIKSSHRILGRLSNKLFRCFIKAKQNKNILFIKFILFICDNHIYQTAVCY